jgi:hypothetical protein
MCALGIFVVVFFFLFLAYCYYCTYCILPPLPVTDIQSDLPLSSILDITTKPITPVEPGLSLTEVIVIRVVVVAGVLTVC